MNQTNINWYPYEDMGCWYKLENGQLHYAPMNLNGTIETINADVDVPVVNDCEVEMDLIKDEPLAGVEGKTVGERLQEIIKELENKD